MNKFAHLSEDGRFRFSLTRVWDESKPVLTFVMLNPSTADGKDDDATVRKCIGFAQRLGFGSIMIVNLFSFRTRDPDTLKAAGFPGAGYEDNSILVSVLTHTRESGGKVCCAWGTYARHSRVAARANEVLMMLKKLGMKTYALRILLDGTPSHPLMLPYSLSLLEFEYA